jgi:uncharacterized protein YbjT (DUF2867 family)
MNILILGATGMLGHGVLQECLAANDVQQVITLGRTSVASQHAKLVDVVHPNLFDLTAIESRLSAVDACFFCLGVSAYGMSESDYRHLTYALTLSVANKLSQLNPQMTFVYVSGEGTDSSEQGKSMWARVKGQTENALMQLPFKAVYLFRPGIIQPVHGVHSKTRLYRLFYKLTQPVLPVLRRLFPNAILTTQVIGQAMLNAARQGLGKQVFNSKAINALSMAIQ